MIYKSAKMILSRAIVTYGAAVILLFVMGNYKKACIQRLNVLPVSMSDYPILFDKGALAFNETSVRESLHYYKILREAFPDFDQPYNMIGYCYAIDGNPQSAIQYYLEAKKINPQRLWYDYNLGVLYDNSGDEKKALAYFKDIIGSDTQKMMKSAILAPLSTLPQEDRLKFYKKAFDFSLQIKDLSLRHIIKIYFHHERYEEAMIIALKASQDNTFIKNKLVFLTDAGVAAYQAGKFDIALRLFKNILDQQPGQIWAKTFVILTRMDLEGVGFKENEKILEEFLKDPVLFPAAMGKIMLHPWSYLITPGKEIYL